VLDQQVEDFVCSAAVLEVNHHGHPGFTRNLADSLSAGVRNQPLTSTRCRRAGCLVIKFVVRAEARKPRAGWAATPTPPSNARPQFLIRPAFLYRSTYSCALSLVMSGLPTSTLTVFCAPVRRSWTAFMLSCASSLAF